MMQLQFLDHPLSIKLPNSLNALSIHPKKPPPMNISKSIIINIAMSIK